MNRILFQSLALVILVLSGLPHAFAQDLSADEQSHLRRVNVFFNTIGNMEGDFIQIDPMGRESSGRFFMARPGKIRFQYEKPGKSAVVSDGSWVAIQDRKGTFIDRYPLISTPLRFLLRERVDLLKDAAIENVASDANTLSVTMSARKSVTPGKLVLNFALPNYNLISWTVLDAQGQRTSVAIGNLEFDKKYNKKLFRIVENRCWDVNNNRWKNSCN